MATAVTKFIANDGTEFDNESAANTHDQSLLAGNSIEAFMSIEGITKAQAGLLRKCIPAYLAFLQNPAAPALIEQAVADRAAAVAAAEGVKAKAKAEKSAAKRAAEADKNSQA